MRSDRGSATIWVLACTALIVALGMVGVAQATAVLARHQAERAADLAALAAAEQIGRTADPCAAARRISLANGVDLQRCETFLDPSARSGTVIVVLAKTARLPMVGDRVVTARARAGRLPAGRQ
jgi:secretion/DNA translocation related TadE-like protein